MKFKVILFLFSIALRAQSQDDRIDQLKTVIPPSPNSAALAKYSEWPVSLYTGVPNISIPIYTVTEKGITVPIDLNYHASGIKVSEVASSVGLGWSLNAGGVITRSVRGLPDDDGSGGFFQFRQRYSDPNDLSSTTVSPYFTQQNLAQVADGTQDGEQDIYSFNALGKSYKLVFMKNGAIQTIPYSKTQFKWNVANDSWTVTLEDGMKLNFGGTGYVERTDNPRADITLYTSSWMLKSIVAPTLETVTLTYQTTQITQNAYISDKDKITNNYVLGAVNGNATCTCGSGPQQGQQGAGKGQNDQSVTALQIATIETPLLKVYFNLDPSLRTDLEGGKFYAGIKVLSKLDKKFIKDFRLNYSYILAVTGNVHVVSSYYTNRLHLTSLEERDPQAQSILNKWKFDYNSQALPSRVSYGQDHWGYFNGVTQNTTLLPDLPPIGFYYGFTPNTFLRGDRNPNAQYMQAEILNRITYPTGGYSKFYYEPNSFPKNEEQFQNASVSQFISSSEANFTNTKTITFQVTKPQYIFLSASATFSAGYLNDNSGTLAYATVEGPNGTPIDGLLGFSASGESQRYFTAKAYEFSPGTYTFKIWSKGGFANASDIYVSATMNYQQSLGVQNINKISGGLRVQKIEDYESDNASPITRTYQYSNALILNELNPTVEYVIAQGEQVLEPKPQLYTSPLCEYATPNQYGDPGVCMQDYLIRNTNVKTSVPTYPIGYGLVTLLNGANGENGKTIYSYTNVPDIYETYDFPFPPPASSNENQRGNLLTQTTFSAAGDTLQKLVNTYELNKFDSIKLIKTGRKTIYHAWPVNDIYKSLGLETKYYKEASTNYKIVSSTTYNYSGVTKETQKTSYYYDNPNNLMATRTETTSSNGSTLKSVKRTALEKADIQSVMTLPATAIAALDSMKSRNMIAQVIQTETYASGTLTNRTTANYKLWFNTANNFVCAPEEVFVQHGSNAAESVVKFTQYDGLGNLREQMKTNDVKHTYLYDYNSSYPIGEVTNADYASVAYVGFEADANINWSVSSSVRDTTTSFTGRKSFLLTSNNLSAQSLISTQTYIVSFWAKSGASVSINGTTATSSDSRNGWNYYEKTLTGVTSVTITGTGNIDEVRLFPKGAFMTTYTYDPLVGTTTSTDANNKVTYYEYDALNRLITVKDDNKKILKTYRYHYKQ